MTISGDTVCSVIQAFPVLLILAQNSNRCLKTPLIYHPPSPTHSPEYYEALDALFQSIHGHGHGHGGHGHGHDGHHAQDNHGCDNNHGYQYDYGYGKKSVHKYYYNHKPCQKPHYGHTGHGHYGQPSYGHGSHGYGNTGHTYGYPMYVLKVNKNHGQGHGHDGSKVYAPNQVYNIKQKSKVVVRKNKRGKQKSAAITLQGFFPSRDNRGYSQSYISPTRIRNRLQSLLHLQPQDQGTNPAFVYPFGNRQTDEYGRPIYQYRPNYEYSRPNYDYGRPGITTNNLMPNQNQFGVPNRNDYQQNGNQNGFQNPPSQIGFQDQPTQNGVQNTPNEVKFPDSPSQNDFSSNDGNGFQNPSSQNGFQNSPNQNQFQNPPSQNSFPNQPSQNEFQSPPSQNGFPEQPSQNGFQNQPSQNGFTNQPSQNEYQNLPTQNAFQNPPSQNGFQNPPSQNGFQNAPSLVDFPTSQDGSKYSDGEAKTTDDIAPNKDATTKEMREKQNEDTLIVIPGNTGVNEDGLVFGGPSNTGAYSNSQTSEAPEVTKAPETPSSTEETPKATEPATVSSVTPAFPPLTPVSADSRNNFNFGPSGIFQETCTTVDNEVGSCLPVVQCQPYVKLIQQSRSNPNALQLLRRAHCGFQGNNPKVCCPRPGIPTGPPPTLPPSTTTTTTTTEAAIVMPVEPEPTEPKELEPQLAPITLPEAPMCGVSNASFSRVVGGIPAKLGDFPWMALLGYKERRTGAGARWLCGGSLISARHVLTAAHCIHTRENDLYLVRLGELDLARDDEGATPVDVLIKTLVKHQEYSPKSFTNDIGILVLSRNVQFTNLIQPICIPRTSELRSRSYENYTPLIAGWGDTEFRGPSATHLQVLQLPVVTNEYCAQAYSAYKAQVIDQRVLCAGFKKGGKDACQGDSGGPLMQPIYDSETYTTFFYQIGVVSYGKKCAEAGFPGVYTRVTNFVPWIEETIANN